MVWLLEVLVEEERKGMMMLVLLLKQHREEEGTDLTRLVLLLVLLSQEETAWKVVLLALGTGISLLLSLESLDNDKDTVRIVLLLEEDVLPI